MLKYVQRSNKLNANNGLNGAHDWMQNSVALLSISTQ